MAKTYHITGYIVDSNGDDLNRLDIGKIIADNELFGTLNIRTSSTWEFTDDCPENFKDCAFADYESRFQEGTEGG